MVIGRQAAELLGEMCKNTSSRGPLGSAGSEFLGMEPGDLFSFSKQLAISSLRGDVRKGLQKREW